MYYTIKKLSFIGHVYLAIMGKPVSMHIMQLTATMFKFDSNTIKRMDVTR